MLFVSNRFYAHVSKQFSLRDGDNVSFDSAVNLELNREVSQLSASARRFIPRSK